MMNHVPPSFLVEFFQAVTTDLKDCTFDKAMESLAEIREFMLRRQRLLLDQHMDRYNKDKKDNQGVVLSLSHVQNALQSLQGDAEYLQSHPDLSQAMESMHETARIEFARLVLLSEHYWETAKKERTLESSRPIEKQELLDFCGLCRSMVQHETIQRYIQHGTPLFDSNNDKHNEKKEEPTASASSALILPQKRLDGLQRSMMRAVGVNHEHGTQELKRLFFTPQQPKCCEKNKHCQDDHNDDLAKDPKVMQAFADMVQATQVTMTRIVRSQQPRLSDGQTRVVSVEHSYKTVDEQGQVLETQGTVSNERMEQQSQDMQQRRLLMAQKAAALQQEILGELLSMDETERAHVLDEAANVAEEIRLKALDHPPGPERVAFLQSIDPAKQRLMAKHKLWTTMLAANGGKPPKMQPNFRWPQQPM